MPADRNKSVDIARGIAMIAIVLGHLGISDINRVVFTFHVPVFYLITGYYLSTKRSPAETLKKKFRTLIVPYFLACAGVIVFAVLFNAVRNCILGDGDTAAHTLRQWVIASLYGAGDIYQNPPGVEPIGAIWFLWATFWGAVFLRLILGRRPAQRIFWVAGLFALGYYSRAICWFPLSIQAGCCAVFFMYAGHLAREIQPRYKSASAELKVSLFVIAAFTWLNFISHFQSFLLVHCNVGRGMPDVIGSLCACFVLMVICGWIEKGPHFICDGLAFLGQNSVFMLCAHIIELNTFPWRIVTDYMENAGCGTFVSQAVKVAGKFIWIIGVTVICAKSNRIRRLFGMINPVRRDERRPDHF